MKFFAVNGTRPVRLSEQTRKFAYDSLNRKYGKETFANQGVSMDFYPNFENLSPTKQYDEAIKEIVKTAPIRICEGEKISGAATYGLSINAKVPFTFNGQAVFNAVNHLTVDFKTPVEKGVDYIEEIALDAFKKYKGTKKEEVAKSHLNAIECFKTWHKRYLDALKDKEEYKNNYEALKQVPFKPAKNFLQAVQSIWFCFAFLRLCGYWSGIGRIDEILGKYLEKDLKDGTLTLNEAREILAHFLIKGCEWVRGEVIHGGDAQHYQNLVLAGINKDGVEVTNDVTYLILEILEELPISDFPTSVRVNKNTPKKLLNKMADVIKLGGGVVALYNEDTVINAMIKAGYPKNEARSFANDGCWEMQVPGETNFNYLAIDSLSPLQYPTLRVFEAEFENFDTLLEKYLFELERVVKKAKDEQIMDALMEKNEDGEWQFNDPTPCSALSLFENGCVEKAIPYVRGGTKYNVRAIHLGGLPDTVNSLYAIKKIVFDDKKLSFKEFMQVLKNNWENSEALRQFALNKYSYYGNDNDEVDEIAAKIVSAYGKMCDDGDYPIRTHAGISSFGRQICWAPYRLACPFGKKAHEILSSNFSPTPATNKTGATAIIKSYCKCDYTGITSGAALDLKLLPSAVNGENGKQAIVSLINGFVNLGGCFMQLDVADTQLLKEAQQNPQDYSTLSVRVSGWNARFVTLSKEWQDMIINQTGSEC